MKWLISIALFATQVNAQHLLTWERKQNTFFINFDDKSTIEVEAVSASTFRILRGLAGPPRKPITDKNVECKSSGNRDGVVLETEDLNIRISSAGLITAQILSGIPVYSEASAKVFEGKAALELTVPQNERFFGLGSRHQAQMDARGLAFRTTTPFFITGNGLAFWIGTPGQLDFDIGKTRADRVRINGEGYERLEYYIAFGPSLKEIWEDRLKVVGPIETPLASELELVQTARIPRHSQQLARTSVAGKDLLCGEARALVHASLSGVLIPAFDLGRYRSSDDATFAKAARLGTFAPIYLDSSKEPAEGSKKQIIDAARQFRARLNHFLLTYADESRSRGYPMIHPLLHQFPRDIEAGRHIDAYMFGDEFLVVPVCDGTPKRDVYLPMGNWTDWNTGKEHRGRRTESIDVPSDGVILLVKSGSVIPLNGVQPADPTELHYFPKNGGEFFIYEPDAADYTQAHASPAVDIYRVEMESKVARNYEWVVHHMTQPKSVVQVEGATYEETHSPSPVPPGKWRFDEKDHTVHIGIAAPAGSDIIVNLLFK